MTRTQETRRALTGVLDQIGGDVEISWQEPPDRTRKERVRRRLDVDDQVLTAPVGVDVVYPWWSSTHHSRETSVVVLHSTSDGVRSRHNNVYGTGPKAGLTRQALRPITSEQVSELGVVYETVTGSPSAEQVLKNRALMYQALDAADARWVLLHGAHALHAWRADLTLKQYAGKVGLWDKRWWVVPVPQVDGVTSRRSEYSMDDWQRLVGVFVDLVLDPDPFHFVGRACVTRARDGVCGGSADHWDEDAVPYCAQHYADAQEKKGEAERKRDRMEAKTKRETLFDD